MLDAFVVPARLVLVAGVLVSCGHPPVEPPALPSPDPTTSAAVVPPAPEAQAKPVDPCANAAGTPLRVTLRRASTEGPVTTRLAIVHVDVPAIQAVMADLEAEVRGRRDGEAERCRREQAAIARCEREPAHCEVVGSSCHYGAECDVVHNDGRLFVSECRITAGEPFATKTRRLAFLRGNEGFVAIDDPAPHMPCGPQPSFGDKPTRATCAVPSGGTALKVDERSFRRAGVGVRLEGTALRVPGAPVIDKALAAEVERTFRGLEAYAARPDASCRRHAPCEASLTCAVRRNDGQLFSASCTYADTIVNASSGTTGLTFVRAADGWRRVTPRDLLLHPEGLQSDSAYLDALDAAKVDAAMSSDPDWDSATRFVLTDEAMVLLGFAYKPWMPNPALPWAALRDELRCPYHALLAAQ